MTMGLVSAGAVATEQSLFEAFGKNSELVVAKHGRQHAKRLVQGDDHAGSVAACCVLDDQDTAAVIRGFVDLDARGGGHLSCRTGGLLRRETGETSTGFSLANSPPCAHPSREL